MTQHNKELDISECFFRVIFLSHHNVFWESILIKLTLAI